jgi:DNA repair ATPase RecN
VKNHNVLSRLFSTRKKIRMMEEANRQLELSVKENQDQLKEKEKVYETDKNTLESNRKKIKELEKINEKETVEYDSLAKQKKSLDTERDKLRDTKVNLVGSS